MAIVVHSVTESASTVDDVAPWEITRPAGVAGRKTILLLACDGTSGWTTPTGYTQDSDGIGAESRFKSFYREEDGTEGTTISVSGGNTEKWVALVFHISGAQPGPHTSGTGTGGTGTDAAPNPPNIIPTDSSKNYLGLAGFVMSGAMVDDDTWITALPTGTWNVASKTSGTGDTADTNVAIGYVYNNFSGSMGVDNFTTSQSLAWQSASYAFMEFQGTPNLFTTVAPRRW